MSISDWKISTKLAAAFGAVLAAIAALGAIVYLQVTELNRTGDAIVESQAVLDTVNRIEKAIDVQESNTRGYLVSQHKKHLDAIADARESYNAQVESLKEQVSRYEGALGRVAKVEEAAEKYFAEIVDLETRLASDPTTLAQALATVRSDLDAGLMDAVDEVLDAIRTKPRTVSMQRWIRTQPPRPRRRPQSLLA